MRHFPSLLLASAVSVLSVFTSVACGGRESTDSSPSPSACDPEPADDTQTGCFAATGGSFVRSTIQVQKNDASQGDGFIFVSGSGGDSAVAESLQLSVGVNALSATPQTFAVQATSVISTGVTSLTRQETKLCQSANGRPCDGSIQKDSMATEGTMQCEATATRIACRFHDVRFPDPDHPGSSFIASGWMHAPPQR